MLWRNQACAVVFFHEIQRFRKSENLTREEVGLHLGSDAIHLRVPVRWRWSKDHHDQPYAAAFLSCPVPATLTAAAATFSLPNSRSSNPVAVVQRSPGPPRRRLAVCFGVLHSQFGCVPLENS